METINDIVSDIRSRNDGGVPLDGESSHCLAADMLELADRIESAYKRMVRSVECVNQWSQLAIKHQAPFGNNYRAALGCIKIETDAFLEENNK